jgi:phage tail sheath protein FI
LSAGDDDRGAIGDTDYVDAMALFIDSLGTGAIACPESNSQAVYQGLIEHANNNNRMAILHTSAGTSDPTTFAEAITAQESHLEHAGLFWPWVSVPSTVIGVSRLIPPDGYVAAVRARAHNQTGAHVPYAGLVTQARFVDGIEYNVGKADADVYDDSRVNVIRTIANTIRVYGARTLTQDTENFRYLTAQEVVNSIVVDAYRSLEDLVFSTIDGRNNVFASVEAKLIGVLEPMRVAGALYEAFDNLGRRIDYGYTVKCDTSLNPVTQLAEGLVRAKVGVRVSSVGDRIEVDIVKSNLTNSVV